MTDPSARTFLEGLAAHLPERPRAILAVSAHWETETTNLTTDAVNLPIHDFYGFPKEPHAICYPAPGSMWLVDRVAALIESHDAQGRTRARRLTSLETV